MATDQTKSGLAFVLLFAVASAQVRLSVKYLNRNVDLVTFRYESNIANDDWAGLANLKQGAWRAVTMYPKGGRNSLVKMYVDRKHSRSCWSTVRGFYFEGGENKSRTCIRLRRFIIEPFRCKSKDAYDFEIKAEQLSAPSGPVHLNVKDNGNLPCPVSGSSAILGGGGGCDGSDGRPGIAMPEILAGC